MPHIDESELTGYGEYNNYKRVCMCACMYTCIYVCMYMCMIVLHILVRV